MKELTITEKAKRYDEAIERAKIYYSTTDSAADTELIELLFPELKESEDKKIIQFLIHEVRETSDEIMSYRGMNKEAVLAWLERQCSEPNWCHHKVDLSNCSEEYCKAYYDGWNNCNMQHSQCKSELDDVVKCLINGMKFYYEDNKEATWGTDKWSIPIKHIIEVLEKQYSQILANSVKTCKDEQKPINNQFTPEQAGVLNKHIDKFLEKNPADKVEPKFREGEWITIKE